MALFKKDFWRYFGSTLLKSKYLILKSAIVAVMWIVISLFANKLDLTNLTIFNAMITIAMFFEWSSLGFGNAIVIFVNNYKQDKEKTKKLISNIFSLFLIFLVLLTVIVCVFKNFILKNVVNLNYYVENSFFYIMIAYSFFAGVVSLLLNILQAFEKFLPQLISTIIQSSLMILGFILIFFSKNFSLTNIAIIFIVVISLVFITLFFILLKNKSLGVNILNFKKFSLSKSEFVSVINIAGTQIIYIVSYELIALFLLKRNENVFNSYQYLENVLDIFNGIFYSFGGVATIIISQLIGEKKYDEAYKIGKYTFLSSFVIWFIYLVLSGIMFYPYILGVNEEIRVLTRNIYFIYVAFYLVRFLSWSFSYYILPSGGKSFLQLTLEILSTVYFILLWIFANSILNNAYLLLTLVFVNELVYIPIFLIYFKSKKWLNEEKNRQ